MIAALVAAGALAAQITASAPDAVQIDHRVPVHGRAVVADGARTVRLQEHTVDGDWYLLATERTTHTGRFRFSVSSGHALTERTLRVVAPPSAGLRRARTAPFVVDIVVQVAGSGRDQQIGGG